MLGFWLRYAVRWRRVFAALVAGVCVVVVLGGSAGAAAPGVGDESLNVGSGGVSRGVSRLLAASAPAVGPTVVSRGAHGSAGDPSAPSGVLVPGLSTAFSDVYRDPSAGRAGALTARIFPVAVNYRAADGSWRPIDDRLVADGSGFHNAADSYGVHVPDDLSQGVSVSSGSDGVSLALEGAHGSGSVSGASDTFAGALPGVSVSYRAVGSGVKESLLLHGSAAPSVLTFDLKVSAGLTPMLAKNGTLLVVGAGRRTAFVLPAPFAYAAASGSELPQPGAAAKRVKEALNRSGDAWTLTLSLDASWLTGALQTRDVVIDPSIDPGDVQNCSIDSDSPTVSSCGGPALNVGYNATGSGSDHRSLIQFDVRDALGPDAVVLNAQLGMYLAGESTSTSKPIGVYQVSRAWTEGTELIYDCGYQVWVPLATWDSYDGTNNWTTPGGDFAATASTVNPSVGGSLGWYYWYPTQLVQSWEDGAANNGLLLKDTVDGQVNNELQFASGGYGEAPYLQVSFEPRLGEQPQSTILHTRLTDRASLDVNAASGNLLVNSLDLHIAGTGLGFAQVRTWQSLDRELHAYGSWSDSNWVGASVYADGSVAVSGLEGGAYLPFIRESDGSFLSPPGVKAVLCTVNGTTCNGSSTYALTFDDSQERIDFNATGQVQGYVDRYGNKIMPTWGSGCGHSFITQWADTQNRAFSQTCSTSSAWVGSVSDQAGGRSVSYNYDPSVSGQLDSFVDANGKTTSYGYTNGEITQITTPAGNVVKMTFDSSGRVTSVMRTTDPQHTAGPTTVYDYYSTGYPSWWTSNLCPAASAKETVVFDPDAVTTWNVSAGHYTSSNGHFMVYCANAQDEVLATVDSASPPDEHEFVYDAYGNLTLVQNTPGNGYLSYVYLDQGQVLGCAFSDSQSHTSCSDTTGLKTTYSYADGTPGHQFLATGVTDPQNNSVQYCYYGGNQSGCPSGSGPSGALQSRTDGLATQNTVNYASNANGTVSSFADADGNQWAYGYDAAGNPRSTTPPAGSGLGMDQSAPDADSRPHIVTDGAGHTATITYDNLDRIKQIAWSGGPTFSYAYDADGNLQTSTDSHGLTTYTTDPLGRLTEEAFPDGSYNNYTWDPNSNLIEVSPSVGDLTSYYYNGLNQNYFLQSPSASATFGYDAEGRRSETTYGNGDQISYLYDDPTSRLTQIEVTNSSEQDLLDLVYSYAPGGCGSTSQATTSLVQCSSTGFTSALWGGQDARWSYSYDAANRLTRAFSELGASSYSYVLDGNGNHISETIGSTTTRYAYNSGNELCATSTTGTPSCANPTFTYDGAGNELTGTNPNGSYSFTYNNADQTTSITPPGSSSDTVTYRGTGESDLLTVGSATYQNSILGIVAQDPSGGVTSFTRSPASLTFAAESGFGGGSGYSIGTDPGPPVGDPGFGVVGGPGGGGGGGGGGNLVAENSAGATSYYAQDVFGNVIALLGGSSGDVAHAFAITPDGGDLPGPGCRIDTFGAEGGLNEPGGLNAPSEGGGFKDPLTGSVTQPGAAEDATVPLYRAVSEAEFKDATGSQLFRQGPNSMEGKWFAERGLDAAQWGEKVSGSAGYRILQTEVPQSYANGLFSNPFLDGIGPARYAENLGELNAVHRGITEWMP